VRRRFKTEHDRYVQALKNALLSDNMREIPLLELYQTDARRHRLDKLLAIQKKILLEIYQC